MNKIDNFTYEVVKGEKITLTFNPFGIPPEVITAALDGAAIDPDPADPQPTYNFAALVPKDESHFFKVECDFVGAGDDAKVAVMVEGMIEGASSGQFFFNITKKQNIHDPMLTFTVVAAS